MNDSWPVGSIPDPRLSKFMKNFLLFSSLSLSTQGLSRNEIMSKLEQQKTDKMSRNWCLIRERDCPIRLLNDNLWAVIYNLIQIIAQRLDFATFIMQISIVFLRQFHCWCDKRNYEFTRTTYLQMHENLMKESRGVEFIFMRDNKLISVYISNWSLMQILTHSWMNICTFQPARV